MYDLKSAVFSIVVYLLVTSAIGALAALVVLKWRRSRPVGYYLSEHPFMDTHRIFRLFFTQVIAVGASYLFFGMLMLSALPSYFVFGFVLKKIGGAHDAVKCYSANRPGRLVADIEIERGSAMTAAGLNADEKKDALSWNATLESLGLEDKINVPLIRVGASIRDFYQPKIDAARAHKCPYETNPERCNHRFQCEDHCERLADARSNYEKSIIAANRSRANAVKGVF